MIFSHHTKIFRLKESNPRPPEDTLHLHIRSLSFVSWNKNTVLLCLQFCKHFQKGERCCEFECLDPPGEDTRYRERQRLRALILSGNSSATHLEPRLRLGAGFSLLAVAVARMVWDGTLRIHPHHFCTNLNTDMLRIATGFQLKPLHTPPRTVSHRGSRPASGY